VISYRFYRHQLIVAILSSPVTVSDFVMAQSYCCFVATISMLWLFCQQIAVAAFVNVDRLLLMVDYRL